MLSTKKRSKTRNLCYGRKKRQPVSCSIVTRSASKGPCWLAPCWRCGLQCCKILHGYLVTKSGFLQKPIGRIVGLAHPVHNLVRPRRIFQLDADGALDPQLLDLPQIRGKLHDAATGRQIAVHLAVAVAQVDVNGFALEPAQLRRRRARSAAG